MIANVSKNNTGKLLVAVLAMFMIVAGAAVVFSDNGSYADAATPDGMVIKENTIELTKDVTLNESYRLPANITTVDGKGYSIIDNTNGDHVIDTQYSTGNVTYKNIKFVANTNATGSIVNSIMEGGSTVTFDGCEFQTNDIRKAVQVPGGYTPTVFNNCEFNGAEVVYNAGEATKTLTFTNCANLSLSIATSSVNTIKIGNTDSADAPIKMDDVTNSTLKNLINGWNFGNNWAADDSNPEITAERNLDPENILVGSDNKSLGLPGGKITETSTGKVTADSSEVPVYKEGGTEVKDDITYETYYNNWADVQTALTAGEEVTINNNMPALNQNLTVNNNSILNIIGVTITAGTDASGNKYTITVGENGTLNTDGAYIYVGVDLDENAQYSASNTHTLTSDGQLNDSTQVGFGDTLTLTGTVPEKVTVSVFGTLITSDLIVNGQIVSYIGSEITANGTITVAGSFQMNDSDMELAGTITVRNDKSGNASFVMNGESNMTVLENGTFNVNRATGNGAQANYLTVGSDATFVVEGTLNITGTLNGAIQDKGTITFNGTAGSDAEIVIYNGVTLTVTSVNGTMTVSDDEAVIADYAGIELNDVTATNSSQGNSVVLTDVRGVTVSVTVSDATYDPSSGDKKVRVYTSDMAVTGTVSKATSASSGSITINGKANSVSGIKDASDAIGTMTVGDMSLGRNLSVTFDGTVEVAGTFNANISESSRDGGITLVNNGELTVSGTMIVGEGVTETLSTTDINAVFYSVTSTGEGTAVTDYYTNFANAIAAIGDADDDRILVYGEVTVEASAEIANGMTVQIQNASALIIDVDVTLTVADGGVLDVSNGSNTSKAVDVNGVLVITNNATGLTGSANAIDYDVLKSVGNTDTYSSLAYALSVAQPGETITLSSVVTLDSNTTIPEGVVLNVPRNTGLVLEENVTLTVNGTLAVQGGKISMDNDSKTWGDYATITVNGVMSMTGTDAETTLGTYNISGAYFTLRNVGYVTNVAYAAQNVDNGEITLKGQVSFGDVTFTARANSDLTITVENLNGTADGATVVNAGTITLVGATFKVQSGTVTAVITAAANGSTASIDLNKAGTLASMAIEIVSDVDSTADGDVDVLYLNGYIQTGTVTIASGTVTVPESSYNYDLVLNSNLNQAKGDGTIAVASGATLDFEESTETYIQVITGETDSTVMTVDGTVDLAGTLYFTSPVAVAGTINVNDNGNLSVEGSGVLTVTGTVAVTEAEDENAIFTVETVLVVGDKPTTLGATGAAGTITGDVKIDGTGYIKAYPGADLSAAKINWQDATEESTAVSTVFNINDTVYMTVYAVSDNKVTVQSILNAEEFELNGYDVGLKGEVSDDLKILYLDTNWYTADTMLANQKIVKGSYVGTEANASIYAAVEASYVKGTISEGTGLDLYIDNIRYDPNMDQFKDGLQVGTHTVSFEVTTGYDGSNAKITFNGVEIQNGGTITIEAGATGFNLVANGAVPSSGQPVVVGGDSDGMSLTDILLIVLVVLILVMAIIVALRLMRS